MTLDFGSTTPAIVPARPPVEPPARPKRRSFWQLSLRTLLLVMVACAVWTAHVTNERRAEELERESQRLAVLVRDLHVKDVTKASFVREIPMWYDETRIQYYLPPGKYQLRLATREISDDDKRALSDKDRYPANFRSVEVPDGTHLLSFEMVKSDDAWTLRALLDDKPILEHQEPKDWIPGTSSTGGARIDQLEQFDATRPIDLFRRRYLQPTDDRSWVTPKEPYSGVLYWIERQP